MLQRGRQRFLCVVLNRTDNCVCSLFLCDVLNYEPAYSGVAVSRKLSNFTFAANESHPFQRSSDNFVDQGVV